jgi:lysyl-tRNA synthetase class 2
MEGGGNTAGITAVLPGTAMDMELLEERARIIREIRSFFDRRNYLEVDTPILAPDLIPESCLEVFETSRIPPAGSRMPPQPCWLVPSPEIWMKRLIARQPRSLYQICKCFRNGESTGRLHSPEFTMLEYYTMDADYLDSLKITEELFAHLIDSAPIDSAPAGRMRPPFLRITMEEAFSRWAGFNLYEAAEGGTLEAEARRLGLDPPPGLDSGALYDLIFIHRVEPALPMDRPVALMDYPAFVPCLARGHAKGKTRERWELYFRGIELANCYSEETGAEEVRRYFEAETANTGGGSLTKKNALVPHAVDRDYWRIFENFPRCSGNALGVDRLIMALTGRSTIDSVLPFPMGGA